MKKQSLDDTRHFTEMVAKKQGWVLSRDKEFYEDLVSGLNTNVNRYSYYLCPCRDTAGSLKEDRPILCPCVYAKADIDEYGHCYCSLYWSPAFAESGKEPVGIPDRHVEDSND